jgi:uncharacterized protein (TIGR02246 family)
MESKMARRRLAQVSTRLTMAAILVIPFAWSAAAGRAQEKTEGTEADSQAIKQVFAQWYEAFSRHDAHAASMTFSEDADFTNMGGVHSHGQKEVEDRLARLFAGNLKAAKRTDMVKSIRYFSPDLAEVDADTVIHGNAARRRFGSAAAQRADGRHHDEAEWALVHQRVPRSGVSGGRRIGSGALRARQDLHRGGRGAEDTKPSESSLPEGGRYKS